MSAPLLFDNSTMSADLTLVLSNADVGRAHPNHAYSIETFVLLLARGRLFDR